jgi:hypothetical protein
MSIEQCEVRQVVIVSCGKGCPPMDREIVQGVLVHDIFSHSFWLFDRSLRYAASLWICGKDVKSRVGLVLVL